MAGVTGHVVVYTILGCPNCMRAKQLLSKANIAYTDVSLDSFPQCHEEVIERSKGDPSVPQIFYDDVHIGGVDELQELVENATKWDQFMEQMAEREVGPGPPVPLPSSAVDLNENENEKGELLTWLPDEYSKLVNEMRKANLIRDNRVGLLKTYRNSFKGDDLIEWIVREKGLPKKEALEIGQDLIDKNFGQQASKEMGTSFSPDRYYQLIEDDDNQPLNCGMPQHRSTLTINEFNANFVTLVEPIYKDIQLNEDKLTILYHRLVDNDHYSRYLQYAKELQVVDPSKSTPDERLAFFVNIYNIMLVHMAHKYGPPHGLWQRRKYMNSTYYQIENHRYSPQSILNGILRSNRKGLGMLWKSFGTQDERLPLILPECDPLIHFAISPGARSSPPLRAYTTKGVRQEMAENARKYLMSDENMRIDSRKNILHLPKMFKWFAGDFGSTPEKIIGWILRIFQEDQSDKAKALRKMFYTGDYTIDYIPYDWTFNGKEKKRQDHKKEKPTPVIMDEYKTDAEVAKHEKPSIPTIVETNS